MTYSPTDGPPNPPPWPPPRPKPEGPNQDQQPLRADANIQGNVLAGFNKDHQMLLFVRWSDVSVVQQWLTALLPRLATNDAVTAFNERFSTLRANSNTDPADLTAVWTNVSFTADGISDLAPASIASLHALDNANTLEPGLSMWLRGADAPDVAPAVGDTAASAPDGWLFGRPGQLIHAVVCIAADERADLDVEVTKFRNDAAQRGLEIVFEQPGATLPGPAHGHEHFGFKDGISQPGVRGYDTPSTVAGHTDEVDGKLGTDLIAAGTFLLGYPRDSGEGIDLPTDVPVPKWMWDGSFLTTRRLAQDVPGFWSTVEATYDTLQAGGCPAVAIPNADALAAKLVGRWRSGTPTDLAPTADNRSTHDPANDNAFDFAGDLNGESTPFVAHIRKVYPRQGGDSDAVTTTVSEPQTMGRRILRRGIPFGDPFVPVEGRGDGIDAERGLLFQCYQASLADQFVFLQQRWINEPAFPLAATGNDAVIGNASNAISIPAASPAPAPPLAAFVRTEGSLFSFTPSVPTVALLAEGADLPDE